MRKIKIYLLRKLFLWWINYDDGRDLRGADVLEKVSYKLFEE